MMVSAEHKYVFLAVPRCATNSMYDLLAEHFAGRRTKSGPHAVNVPPGLRHWFTWAIVRNPYARAVSIWWRSTRDASPEVIAGWRRILPALTLVAFMRGLLGRVETRLGREVQLNQADFLSGIRLDAVVHLESLKKELALLPFWRNGVEIPRSNASSRPRKWWQCVSPAAAKLIEEWAGADFEQYGYDRWPDGKPDGSVLT